MLPFNRHELHCVCLNHPFGIETVQYVEDNTQVLHDTAGGEGGRNSQAAMGGDERIDAVRGDTMMEWFNGSIRWHGECVSHT